MTVQVGRQRVVNTVRTLPLFADGPQQDLFEVASFSVLRHMPRGQSLFSQHEPCASVCYLVSGLVKLARYGSRGGEQIIDIAGPGRMLGLTALLSGSGYSYDGVAVDDCEILVVQALPLLRFIEQRTERLMLVGRELARGHERMVARVEQLIGRTAVQRVALYLLESSSPLPAGYAPPPLIGIIRRADVANMLGLTPETFSRVLARFRRTGFIRDQGGVVEVLNRSQLGEVLQDPGLMRSCEEAANA